MAPDTGKFVIDKEVLKPGLILFRRSDVQHRNWYCRVKVPKEDRYKTVSLKTENINDARAMGADAGETIPRLLVARISQPQ